MYPHRLAIPGGQSVTIEQDVHQEKLVRVSLFSPVDYLNWEDTQVTGVPGSETRSTDFRK